MNICTVITKNCLKEFLLTKFSCEQFNDCKWFVICDKYCYDFLKKYNNINLFLHYENDDLSNHNSLSKEEKKSFLNIILHKFNIIEETLKNEEYVLFIDSDMLFVGSLEQEKFDLLKNKQVDFVTSPHYTNNLFIEEKYGFYNVGMFAVNDAKKLTLWKELTKEHEKNNLYYEQKPFELVLKNYYSLALPINYNIGWWRFNNENTKNRINQLILLNDQIYFGSLKAVNFHFHVFKEINGYNPGKFLVDLVFNLLKNSNNKKYYDIIKYYEELSATII